MKKLSKILSVLLCLAMIVGVVAVMVGAEESTTPTWAKVTEAPADWSGTYLIVYEVDEANAKVFDGSNSRDAVSDYVTASISNGTISLSADYAVTIAAVDGGYTIQGADGNYIYSTANENKLNTTKAAATAAKYPHALSMTDGVLDIASSSTAHLRFNNSSASQNGDRYRYYKSSSYTNQKAVCLYKLVESSTEGTTEEETTESTTEAAPVLPEADSTLTIAEAKEVAQLAGDNYTSDKYYVTGTVTTIESDYYGNLYIEDTEGNSLYIYGLRGADGYTYFNKLDVQPKVGDTITIYTILGTFKDSPQAKNAAMTELVPGEVEVDVPEDGSTLTVEEALAIAPYSGDNKYYITGEVTGTYGNNWATYGNLYITDETGEILIYGLFNEDGTVRYDAMEVQPIVGDTITVYTALTTYNQVGQATNAWLTELTLGDGHEEEIPEESTGATEGTEESTGATEGTEESTGATEGTEESTGSNVSGDTGDKTPGDTLSVFVGLLAVSTVGLAVVTSKKKAF